MVAEGHEALARVVERTRRRMRWQSALATAAKLAPLVIALAAIAAASRALLWPTGADDVPLAGLPRALALFGLALVASGAVVWTVAWRRARPSGLAASMRIDEHLELEDVVASAWAFANARARGVAAQIAIVRGERAIASFDPRAALPTPRLLPRASRALLASITVALALAIGTLDATLVGALVSPPTVNERAAASALEREARRLERQPAENESAAARRARREAASRARQIARAARRGDRGAALAALRALDAPRQERIARVRQQDRELASLASSIGAPRAAGSPGARPDAASQAREAASLLRREAREGAARDPERDRRMLERLQRAAQRAEQREGARSELAQALNQARSALSQGDREAASQALERAAQALERMGVSLEEARAALARQAQLHQAAGELERALQRGQLGQGEGEAEAWMEGEGGQEGEGQGEGRTLSSALSDRLAALGLAQSPGIARGGGSSRSRGRPAPGLAPARDLRSPSEIRGDGVGPRAVAAVRGMGANGEPTTEYRDVYPAYGVRVEEALADERIPPARRRVVRRYFESIRPEE